jgi:hypothetical protein
MKDFLILIRGKPQMEEKANFELTIEAEEWTLFLDRLSQNGQLVAGLPLASEGAVILSDGTINPLPVVKTSENIVTGYLHVKTRNLAEAIAISIACHHLSKRNEVEVREITPLV